MQMFTRAKWKCPQIAELIKIGKKTNDCNSKEKLTQHNDDNNDTPEIVLELQLILWCLTRSVSKDQRQQIRDARSDFSPYNIFKKIIRCSSFPDFNFPPNFLWKPRSFRYILLINKHQNTFDWKETLLGGGNDQWFREPLICHPIKNPRRSEYIGSNVLSLG